MQSIRTPAKQQADAFTPTLAQWEEEYEHADARHDFRGLAASHHTGRLSALEMVATAGICHAGHAARVRAEARRIMRDALDSGHGDWHATHRRAEALSDIADRYPRD